MRNLFIVLIKVFGFFALIRWVSMAFSLVAMVNMLGHGSASGSVSSDIMSFGGVALYAVMVIAVFVFAVFKTDKLADWLRVPDGEIFDKLDADDLMLIGIRLVGIYFLLTGMAQLANSAVTYGNMIAMGMERVSVVKLIPPLLIGGIGAFIALKSEAVVRFILSCSEISSKKIVGAVLILFVLMTVIFMAVGRMDAVKMRNSFGRSVVGSVGSQEFHAPVAASANSNAPEFKLLSGEGTSSVLRQPVAADVVIKVEAIP